MKEVRHRGDAICRRRTLSGDTELANISSRLLHARVMERWGTIGADPNHVARKSRDTRGVLHEGRRSRGLFWSDQFPDYLWPEGVASPAEGAPYP